MNDIHQILRLLEDFVFNENINITTNLSRVIKKITILLNGEWSAVYILPVKENFLLKEQIFVTSNTLKKIFHVKSKLFKKTLLYKLKINAVEKLGRCKMNSRYPEYRKGETIYGIRKNFKQFIFIMECAFKEKKSLNQPLLQIFIQFIKDGLEKRYNEIYYGNRLRELLNLIEIGKFLNSTVHLEKLLNKLFSEVKETMHTEGCSLMLIDKKTGELKFKTVKGKKGNIIKEFTVPSGKGIAGWIVNNRKAIVVNDVMHDKRFYQKTDKMSGFKTKNLIGAPLIVNNELIGVIEAVNRLNNQTFTDSDKDIFLVLANQAAIAIQNARYYKELQDLFLNTVKSLSAAIDAKDKYTIGHSERVTKYSTLLAKELQLDPELIKQIELASLLHDIGKIGIVEGILQKPDKLNDKEFEVIKQHPCIGEDIIKPIPQLKEILPGIRNHHERWDGRGYPDQLQGENIPLLGRIISLGDTYDAITSDRPYRKGLSVEVACDEILRFAGTQFDPALAKLFITIIQESLKDAIKENN